MTEISPVTVEQAIRQCSERIAKGVMVCDKQYRNFLTLDRAYEVAFAHAYMQHEGPSHEKKYAAQIETEAERELRDAADAAYRYADRQARALQDELRAWQSVGASLRTAYAVAGTGER